MRLVPEEAQRCKAETQKGPMAEGQQGWLSTGGPTLVWMVREKAPAQLQYVAMLVSFTPRHFRQICNEKQPQSGASLAQARAGQSLGT